MEARTISVREASVALGCGKTKLYELLNSRAVRSFLLGRSRRVIAADIDRLIALALEQQTGATADGRD